MARNFVTNDIITFPAPAALIGVDGGPLTIVAVMKLNASAYHVPIYTRTSASAHAWWVEVDTPGGLHANYGTGTTPRNVGTVSTGAYFVGIFRKDASGSFQPVGRFLTGTNFSTDSGNITATSTLIDGSALDSGSVLQFGRWGTVDYSNNFDLAAVAVWSSYVADGTVTTFTTWSNITSASPTYWAKFEGSTVTDSASQSPTITNTTTASDPSGFFGAADQNVAVNGITSAEALGNATVSSTYTIAASGIVSAERLGSANVTAAVGAGGIASSERLGSATVSTTYTINAHGIGSSERLGSTALSSVVSGNGIVSSERLGQPSISRTVSPSGIQSSERLGAHQVQPGAVTINASGITSSAAVGTPVVILAQIITANGIATLEALGTPTISVGAVTVNASGISSGESFGNAQLGVSITPAGIPSSEGVGAASITVTAAGVSAGNITSSERLGSPTITTSVTINAHGVRSAEQLGASTLYRQIAPGGVGSTESLGSPTITVGTATINAAGILSAAGLGTPIITALPLVAPTPNTLIKVRIGQTVLKDSLGRSDVRMS